MQCGVVLQRDVQYTRGGVRWGSDAWLEPTVPFFSSLFWRRFFSAGVYLVRSLSCVRRRKKGGTRHAQQVHTCTTDSERKEAFATARVAAAAWFTWYLADQIDHVQQQAPLSQLVFFFFGVGGLALHTCRCFESSEGL